MPLIIADRVRESSSTAGTGSYTLSGALASFRAFSSVCVNADTAYYAAVDNTTGGWEVGLGTWSTGNMLARTTILASSNAGSAVNWGTGTRDVFLTSPAAFLSTRAELGTNSDITRLQGLTGGSASSPAITFSGDTNTGIYSPAADTIAFSEGGVESLRLDSNGNATFTGTAVMASSFLRNRIINGGMAVDQRNAGATQTFTAGAALAYSVDRWYGYCTGANVTGQRVTGAVANTFRYQFTGAASVTAIGFGQRMEALNTADLSGQTCTVSVDLANSLLTTVTWTAFYANTTDAFGTLASPTRTQIATGTFTVTSAVTRYSTTISVPGAATTGIEIVFTVGAQTSGTWTIGNVQFEAGSAATPFERRQYGQELALCQRYFAQSGSIFVTNQTAAAVTVTGHGSFPVTMRASPTLTATNATGLSVSMNRDIGLSLSIAAFNSHSTGTISGNAEL